MTNNRVVLIMGKPNSGKSWSLRNIKNPEKWVYLNLDLKDLPFQDNFHTNMKVPNAAGILNDLDALEANAEELGIEGVIIDTITFMMSMYERQNVVTASQKDAQKAWGDYGNFYRDFIHRVKAGKLNYAILAHEDTRLNENERQLETVVPVKGAVGKIGVEADFTTILSTKQLTIPDVQKALGDDNKLLTLSPEEEEDGIKRVFCTRVTKDTLGEKMRSADGLWSRKELYIDNDLEQVFARINSYYNG